MAQYRVPTKKSKYFVPAETYLTTVHYCRQYPLWKQELETEPDTSKGISYDKERVQSSNQYDATSDIAMRRQMIGRKKQLVDDTAALVGGPMAEWIILGVAHGLTYYQLQQRGMPCGKNMYYGLRQRFYFELSKEI
jgi:hypothetical protein